MRDLINIITEKALTASELSKHNGKYLLTLINLAGNGIPLPVDPQYRSKFGDVLQYDPAGLPELQRAVDSGDIAANLPKQASVLLNGEPSKVPWGVLFKGKEFTGAEGKKSYNTGHLAELMMGLAVSAKFFNLGEDVTMDEVIQMASFADVSIPPGTKNYRVSLNRAIDYPESGSKKDTLNFLAVVPARSAESFFQQLKSANWESDLAAVFNSAVKYANESEGVANACNRVRQDKNNNQIDVVSDGTSDAKGTKADLTLKIDGTKVNLLSLKTYSTDTLGQISGIGFDQVNKWFDTSFGLKLDKYRSYFDDTLPKETVYKNILKLYDDVIFPAVKDEVETQSPGQEAAIVRKLASAANYFARGESLEDVEIVKLDDQVSKGNYKILKFSDNLYDAMKELDLEAKLIGGGQGRTIQIFVKPEEGKAKGDKLCQFRTQKMGDSYRNYYETGPMLEKLTAIDSKARGVEPGEEPKGRLTGPGVKASRTKDPDFDPTVTGRERRR